MSSRARRKHPKPINREKVAAVLARLYGGDPSSPCPDCAAVTTAWRDPRGGPVHVEIDHSGGCPWLAAREARYGS